MRLKQSGSGAAQLVAAERLFGPASFAPDGTTAVQPESSPVRSEALLLLSHSNERGLLCLLQVFERILFIWAIRHPASGYVQGINDLVTPFFVVFLSEFVSKSVLQKACRCWCRTLACAPSLCFQRRMWRTLRCRLCRCKRRGTSKLIPFGA